MSQRVPTPYPPVTTGATLRAAFSKPLGLSANALAKAVRLASNRITAVLHRSRSITTDTAFRLAHDFDTTPEFWLNS